MSDEKIGGRKFQIDPSHFDEQEHLIKQLIRRGQELVYEDEYYPVAITNDPHNIYEKTGLKSKLMNIPRDKYFKVISRLK